MRKRKYLKLGTGAGKRAPKDAFEAQLLALMPARRRGAAPVAASASSNRPRRGRGRGAAGGRAGAPPPDDDEATIADDADLRTSFAPELGSLAPRRVRRDALFGGNIDGIAINQFWKVPTGFWPVILLFIAVPETFRALRGWMEPTVPENYFVLRAGYTPGDIDFDPSASARGPGGVQDHADEELQHGRLAMLAAAGMIVQELQTGNTALLGAARPPIGSGGRPSLLRRDALFGGNIDGIAINQFWKVPTGFWPVILLFIAVPETFSAPRLDGADRAENYFQLRSGYTPGDIDFDPLGLCPADAMEQSTMARLAFALAATCASTSALGADGRQGVHVLNVATTSYDPSDFSDVTKLPGILAPVEFFDP
ncbi:chlorophyll A-B binding protein [Aureococcus anophagefferens]|nr:chlorophyll A-B binding protein [Aureococcus anophagefferens]